MSTIKTFNTGRGYTAEGQRIAYEVIETYYEAINTEGGVAIDPDLKCQVVSFADIDRGIDGTVNIWTDDDPTPGEVLSAYDRGGYGWDEDRDRVKRLYEAANSANP